MSSCINFFPLHLFASIINDISYFYACLLWCDRTNGPLNPLWDRWFEGPQESQGCRCWILWYWWLSSGFIALIVDCWLLAESSSYRVQHFLAMLWHMFDRVLRCVESNSYMATFLNFQIYNEILHCAIHDEFLWEIQMYGTIYSNGNEYWAQFDSTQWHFKNLSKPSISEKWTFFSLPFNPFSLQLGTLPETRWAIHPRPS